jgi:hypothetical protein
MANVTIRNLIDRAREFERRLEAHYAAIRDRSKDDGVRLLTYYLSRHRRHLDEAIAGYGGADLQKILEVRLKQDVVFDPAASMEIVMVPPAAADGQQLLEAAVAHDLELVGLYRRILEQPLGEGATALVRSLVRLEERDIVMLKKMIAMHYF